MKKEQLILLLKHGELWTNDDYRQYLSKKFRHNKKFSFDGKASKFFKGKNLNASEYHISILGVRYTLGMKLYEVLEQLFEYFYDHLLYDPGFADHPIERFKEDINNKLLIYSTAKEDRVQLFNDKIIEENNRLENLIGEFWFISPSTESIKSMWCDWLLEEGEDLIECLKFDVFKGKEIKEIEFWPFEKHPADLSKIWKYFDTKKMHTLYDSALCLQKIYYLRNLISDLENRNPEEKKLTHREEALVHFYMEKFKLEEPLTVTEIRKRFGQRRYVAFTEIGYFASKNYKPAKIKELRRVSSFLAEFPMIQKAIENDIENSIKNTIKN